MYKYSS